MASKITRPTEAVHKLHLVTLMRSAIKRPWWEKRMVKSLGLSKRMKQVVVKNSPEMNERLRSIKTIIRVQPIIIKDIQEEEENVLTSGDTDESRNQTFSLAGSPLVNPITGEFNKALYDKYVAAFPETALRDELVKETDKGQVNANRNWDHEREQLVTDKSEQVQLFFKKKIAPPGRPANNKLRHRDLEY